MSEGELRSTSPGSITIEQLIALNDEIAALGSCGDTARAGPDGGGPRLARPAGQDHDSTRDAAWPWRELG